MLSISDGILLIRKIYAPPYAQPHNAQLKKKVSIDFANVLSLFKNVVKNLCLL